MKLILHEYKLTLRHVFTTGRSSNRVQETLIAELAEGEHSGLGEATTSDYYHCTLDGMRTALEDARPRIEAESLEDPAVFWDRMLPHFADNRPALSALDQAAHDLWAKQRGSTVRELWNLSSNRMPESSYTIGLDSIGSMVAKLREMPGWPIYKIKLGREDALQIVEALRQETDAVFRVDANTAWTADETIEKSRRLAELGVEFIEQPLPADRWEDMKQVRQEASLPMIADESCVVENDVDRCEDCFDGINIKLVKCGGLTPARRMIARARELNLQVMLGCMTESSVGISALAQLLPMCDYADMDGATLLASDIASGVRFVRGKAKFPDSPGCGAALLKARG